MGPHQFDEILWAKQYFISSAAPPFAVRALDPRQLTVQLTVLSNTIAESAFQRYFFNLGHIATINDLNLP
jgi:hypothetical protein